MLDLYTWRTPNGRKVPILLAELDVPYNLHPIDIGKGEQKTPAYLAINPNGKIPALVDGDVVVFESGAILAYLATKHGKLLPTAPKHRAEAMSWLWWQVAGPGPTFGQVGYYVRTERDNPRAYERFFNEARRQIGVLDTRLADREFIATDYTIADIACYPWFAAAAEAVPGALDDAGHVTRWMATMATRPAVITGMSILPGPGPG